MLWTSGGSYNEWATHLERWAHGEATGPGLPPVLDREDFPADTWERLLQRIWDALNRRLQSWADALGTAVAAAQDEFEVGRALTQAREGLRSIRGFTAQPGLPADLRERLGAAVDKQLHSLQESLEQEAERLHRLPGVDRRMVEARIRTMRDNALTAVVDQGATPGDRTADAWFVDPAAVPRRRIIID